MVLNRNFVETKSTDFKVRYDKKHDILRVFSNPYVDYSYEPLTDCIELMVQEDTDIVIGIQITDFKLSFNWSNILNKHKLTKFAGVIVKVQNKI